MKKVFIFFALVLTIRFYGQTFYTELYGFKLGQYREAAKLELGNPIQYGRYDDGFVFEAYLLKPDTSLYIIFEYAANDTNLIWSIQVSGSNTTTDIGFKNAKLGLDKTQTENFFGKPSSIEDIGEYGQKWDYSKTNFSIEVNTKGEFSSIKILDNTNQLFPSPEVEKIPDFKKIQQTLASKNKVDILNLLAGDIEIYKGNMTYFFKKSFKTELTTDYSKMFSIIGEISTDLSTVNPENADEYEENMRLALGEDIKHVIKIKKGHLVKEIVLKYYGGQYLIYEINASSK
ncbi:MAG TPA: hypothetical protein VKG26_14280 [Bacteroidia bacterium]|nr:hypothetical protein [Bacteroidia bacterium]